MQLLILLDKARQETLTEQLSDQLRQAIAKGRIARGARLPSSRNLADQLGISRNTVVRAYEALIMEGHVEARPASGIYVSSEASREVPRRPGSETTADINLDPNASQPAPIIDEDLKRFSGGNDRRMMVDFAPDQTSAVMFPLKIWRRLIQDHLSGGATGNLSAPGNPPVCRNCAPRSRAIRVLRTE